MSRREFEKATISELTMTHQLETRLIFVLCLASLCHLYNCASYRQFVKYGQQKSPDQTEDTKLVRVKLSRSEELDSFEALKRSHDTFKNNNVEKRKPIGLNSQLVGSVGIGSPVQEFRFIFETTYSNMWVASLNCSNCEGKKRYNSSASTTYIKDGRPIQTSWDIGFRSIDDVSFGDIVLDNLTFEEMLNIGDFAVGAPYDGLFCLGYDNMAQGDVITPLRKMLDQNLIDRERFSIYQNLTGGEIVFGGFDERHFKGKISWVPNYGLVDWAFKMDSVILKQSSISEEVTVCANGCEADIYTYLPYIIGPPKDVMLINEAIGAQLDEDDDTIFVLPDCDLSKLPNLAFKIDHTEFELTPEQYIQKVKKGDKIICVSSLHAVAIPLSNEWIIGSSFIGHIYTIFDAKYRLLGFAHTK